MKRILSVILLLPFLHLGCKHSVDSPETTAVQYLSFDEIKNKLTSAQNGDTVIIPAGTLIVNEQITVNGSINIIGAGIDTTIIYSSLTDDSNAPIRIVGTEGTPFRITGITFKGRSTSMADADNHSDFLIIDGTCKNWRIDHCKFTNGGYYGVFIIGYTYGVVDHCEFINAANDGLHISDRPGNPIGSDSWNRPSSLGTDKAIYIEDCNFVFDHKGNGAVEAEYGARYVFRHNIVSTTTSRDASPPYQNPTQCDAHGNTQWGRGTFSVEIYENTLSSTDTYYGIYIRGGTGVIFNNTLTGVFHLPIVFTDYNSFMYTDTTTLCGFVACDYPAPDQVNNFYIWNNTLNGSIIADSTPAPYVINRGLDRTHIQKNRDYFDAVMPGYTSYKYPHPLVK
jgi:hypothetical protein